jgi:hypothetical protein
VFVLRLRRGKGHCVLSHCNIELGHVLGHRKIPKRYLVNMAVDIWQWVVERRGFELMAIGRCRSSDPNRWRNTAHSRQTLPSPLRSRRSRSARPISRRRRADLIGREIICGLHRSWMLTERALGLSASLVRRSVSFALHGHEPYHVVAPTPARTVHRRSRALARERRMVLQTQLI